MSDDYEDWHVKIFEVGEAEIEREGMRPFRLRGMTEPQEEAVRALAAQTGFKDMRGFWKWMEAADLTYYDLIKVASPE